MSPNHPALELQSPHTVDKSTHKDGDGEYDGEHCSICLQPFLDRTVVPICAHQFCFECLVIWSEQSRRCPLCSQPLGAYLIHHIRSKYDYAKYYLNPLTTPLSPSQEAIRARSVRRRREREWGRVRRAAAEADELERAIARRRWVYQNNLYAKHVASNVYTRYRPFPSPSQFTSSPDMIARMATFLRRELRVWTNLDVEFFTTFTISIMKNIDIRSQSAIKLLSEFLDMEPSPSARAEQGRFVNAEHFAHEVYSYLRSPYKDLANYDSAVQYDVPANLSPIASPSGRHQRWRGSRSPSVQRSRSRQPSRCRQRRRHSPSQSFSRSRSRGRSPVIGRSVSRSRSLSWSPSGRRLSPLPRPERGGELSPSYSRRIRRSYSRSRSPSPPSLKRHKREEPGVADWVTENSEYAERRQAETTDCADHPTRSIASPADSQKIAGVEYCVPAETPSCPKEAITLAAIPPPQRIRNVRNRGLVQSIQAHLSSPVVNKSTGTRRACNVSLPERHPSSEDSLEDKTDRLSLPPDRRDVPDSKPDGLKGKGRVQPPTSEHYRHVTGGMSSTITTAGHTPDVVDQGGPSSDLATTLKSHRRMTAPEIMARTRARLAAARNTQTERNANKSPHVDDATDTADGSIQAVEMGTTYNTVDTPTSGGAIKSTDRSKLLADNTCMDTRTKLLGRLEQEMRFSIRQAHAHRLALPASSPECGTPAALSERTDTVDLEREAKLRVQAQLRVRLAAEKRAAQVVACPPQRSQTEEHASATSVACDALGEIDTSARESFLVAELRRRHR